jgi:hypothetical protein
MQGAWEWRGDAGESTMSAKIAEMEKVAVHDPYQESSKGLCSAGAAPPPPGVVPGPPPEAERNFSWIPVKGILSLAFWRWSPLGSFLGAFCGR